MVWGTKLELKIEILKFCFHYSWLIGGGGYSVADYIEYSR